ncbi:MULTISPECIES: hypothetical protein [Agrobacterium]|uniref:hypothetical protein n=1 Tax=Agrobacterium TaxID=357 RepID=UPI001FA95CA0|nr:MULTISPECIES: hypothetical protein [Agrobacterium]UNZ53054.1 hypothetical protein MLE07_20020 [Agrobacterium tumefaciens]
MELEALSPETLADAAKRLGGGPVVMINFLRFRDRPLYSDGFEHVKTTSRSAYYEGYASAFQQIATALNISTELIYAGSQLMTLLPKESEVWDDIVIVRYDSFADLCSIIDTPEYALQAEPHREASVAGWRFVATRSVM